jgi:hypothetical protein
LNLYKSFLATQFSQADTKTHRYASIGTYILKIIVTGPVNTVTKTFSVVVQYPVLTFNVSFSSTVGSARQIPFSGSKSLHQT